MAKYFQHKVTNLLVINKIATIHYLKIGENFKHNTESHNFWEIVFAFEGSVSCNADEKCIILKEGQAIFHKPNEKHSLASASKNSSTVFVANFDSRSPAMRFFENKIITLNKAQIQTTYKIIEYAKNTFDIPESDPEAKKMELSSHPTLGGLQLIKNNLELLLIDIMRKQTETEQGNQIFLRENEFENKFSKDIIKVLEDNLFSDLSIDQIAKTINYSKAYIFKQFKAETGKTVIDYFINLKIKKAKKMLEDNQLSIKQISEKLAFDTPNYFTKTFKKITGFTPTEYKKSHT